MGRCVFEHFELSAGCTTRFCTSCKRVRKARLFQLGKRTCSSCLSRKRVSRKTRRVGGRVLVNSAIARVCTSCKRSRLQTEFTASLKTCKSCLSRRRETRKKDSLHIAENSLHTENSQFVCLGDGPVPIAVGQASEVFNFHAVNFFSGSF